MQAKDVKIRCSSLGYIMTEPRSKSESLSETCKGHLADVMVAAKYGRVKEIETRYTTKGLMVEEDSITLYSRITKQFFKKNEKQLHNEWITGTPDLYEGEGIGAATVVHDIKSSWDIFTFFRQHEQALNKQYYWQMQGYMMLTGAQEARLAYCLINTPTILLMDEMRNLAYKMGAATEETPEYIKACKELEKNAIYDDIPLNERCIIQTITRDDAAIERIKKRVEECREYMVQKWQALFTDTFIASPIPEGMLIESV